VQPRRHREPFDPAPWARELGAIIGDVAAAERLDARSLDRIVKRHPKGGSGLFSKSDIIAGFRRFGPGDSGLSEAEFLARLRLRPVRTLSGVTPVTVLTKPFPCPGTCTFCPSDVRMPKSYLADEPGAQRAEDNRFDPYLQTWNRLAAYRAMGHPVDKVELIVLGGTWSFYPERYQTWFATRCLEALCDFGADVDRRCAAGAAPSRYRALSEKPGPVSGPGYNARVRRMLGAQLEGGLLHESERADAASLREAQRRNEAAACRCVGLAVETRPDHVTEAECLRLRRLGVTKAGAVTTSPPRGAPWHCCARLDSRSTPTGWPTCPAPPPTKTWRTSRVCSATRTSAPTSSSSIRACSSRAPSWRTTTRAATGGPTPTRSSSTCSPPACTGRLVGVG
jgi:hypothetical protein